MMIVCLLTYIEKSILRTNDNKTITKRFQAMKIHQQVL
ncbi:hypothetical protein CFOL_v3_17749 [Cephalotus follicularis]|uniref:Uncharacterized protein n=1 Tax=Cephalotus follicularis TaxID=3775 RepID=A0A1Q3C264_CEPFO|nr:hypothetical protein CFOL_v3_17749 [Cephalotus follicularis]